MATHIDSIAKSNIPKVSKDAFYHACKPGRVVFCHGHAPISLGIETFTGSPFSHVFTLFYVAEVDTWGVLEATYNHGVHVGHLDHYTDVYDGDLLLCDTPFLLPSDYDKLLKAQFSLLDDAYDVGQEVAMVAHKLCASIPVAIGRKEFFCSGYYEQGRRATSLPLTFPGPFMANPEQVFLDPSIVPVCALVKDGR